MTNSSLPTDPIQLRDLYLAERARRESAEAEVAQLRALGHIPQLNPNPVLRLNATGELLFANPAADALARELRATSPSRVRSQLLAAASQALRTGEVAQRELEANDRYFLLFTVPVLEGGYALLFLTDVTARRQAENTTDEQREFYETILSHVPAVVTVLDPEQRYLYINPYAPDDDDERRARLGTTFTDRCLAKGLPLELAVARSRLFERAAKSGQMVSWEEHWPGPDGAPAIYWDCYYQPVFGDTGKLSMMMNYGLDVTTRRQAEERTRQSEVAVLAQQSFTNQVLDLNPNLIWVRDAGGKSLFENAGLAALRERITGHADTTTINEALDPEERLTSLRIDQEVLQSGQQRTTEAPIKMANGEIVWFQTVRRPLILLNGSAQVLGVSTDITVLKAAQHAAEAAATARENFLANMSHEIRTPLNGVLGMTSLLVKTGLSEQQQYYTSIIQDSGRHLLSVVNDVLDMAKITSGKLKLEQAAFNICDSMGKAIKPLLLQAAEKGIRVSGTLLRDSCPHPWVLGDSYRLNQILINLVSNAIKFTPAGGSVMVGGYLLSETPDSLTTEFRVQDTGIGIAPDKVEIIFQEFIQAYADTTRQFGGTGLGLSISQALVAQMGGRLTVRSTPGEGSVFAFSITLPKASSQAQLVAQAPVAPIQEAAVRGCRVLLVEDNPVNREVAQLLLEGHGVVVDPAINGLEALELFDRERYDAVLMDIQMPVMNGLEATARIRAHADAARAATPIMALTANAFRADADRYAAAGMNATLPKPFSEAELLSKLASLIAGVETPLITVSAVPLASAPLPEAAPAPAVAPLFDLDQLYRTAHGSMVFVNRILTSFHANTPQSLTELRLRAAAADWPGVAALAHKLRPTLSLLNFRRATPWLATLEQPAAPEPARQVAAQQLIAGLAELLVAVPTEVAGAVAGN